MLSDNKRVHVAVAVIQNPDGKVLLSLRHENSHQGGLWEFPGGKLESGEDIKQALVRELNEELGIQVKKSRPLIRVRHDYPDRAVLLDVWRVLEYQSEPKGLEGQQLEWVESHRLNEKPMPEADVPVIKAITLPNYYLITPDPGRDDDRFLEELKKSLNAGIRLVQFRAKSLSKLQYMELAKKVVSVCHVFKVKVLLNAASEMVKEVGADGVNLNSKQLALQEHPFEVESGSNLLVGASCHNRSELENASKLGADFAMLSPVLATASHPEAEPLGWEDFQEMTDAVNIPVYALGGMGRDYLETAILNGAQGISAIRALWGEQGE